MQIDMIPIIILLTTTIVTVAVTFYVKDYLQNKTEYSKLRKKLEKVAGKQAIILYGGTGFGPGSSQLYKIIDIDNHGITIQNELQTVFVPAKKLLQVEMVVPCDDYEEAKMKKIKKDMEQFMDNFMPALFDKMFPAMVESMKTHFIEEIASEEGAMGAIIGIKVQKTLSEAGYEIRKLSGPKDKDK